MPLGKKPVSTHSMAAKAVNNVEPKTRLEELRKYEELPFPQKIVFLVILLDMSDSMKVSARPDFAEKVVSSMRDRVGNKALSQIYVHLILISDGLVHSEIVPLRRLKIPEFKAKGGTPLGMSFKRHVEMAEPFFEKLFKQEVAVRDYQTLIISDLKPDGEIQEVTDAGLTTLIHHQTKFRGKITVVGPSTESMDWKVVEQLGIAKESIEFLDTASPESLLQFTLDSLTQVSRKLG